MLNYFQNTAKMKELRDAFKIITEHPAWHVIEEYEQEVLVQLKDRDANISIMHPHYERAKAHSQGEIKAWQSLIESRNKIIKPTEGVSNGTAKTNQPRARRFQGFGKQMAG